MDEESSLFVGQSGALFIIQRDRDLGWAIAGGLPVVHGTVHHSRLTGGASVEGWNVPTFFFPENESFAQRWVTSGSFARIVKVDSEGFDSLLDLFGRWQMYIDWNHPRPYGSKTRIDTFLSSLRRDGCLVNGLFSLTIQSPIDDGINEHHDNSSRLNNERCLLECTQPSPRFSELIPPRHQHLWIVIGTLLSISGALAVVAGFLGIVLAVDNLKSLFALIVGAALLMWGISMLLSRFDIIPTLSGSMRTRCVSASWNVSGWSEMGFAFGISSSLRSAQSEVLRKRMTFSIDNDVTTRTNESVRHTREKKLLLEN